MTGKSKKFLISILIILLTLAAFGTGWKYTTDIDIDMPLNGFPLPVPIFSKISTYGFEGFNPFQMGYYFKRYLMPIKPDVFDAYINFGTVLLVIPYLDTGIDYISQSGLYIGIYLPLAFIPLNGIYSFYGIRHAPIFGINLGYFH
ncbi:MAG: hypothetical protein ACP5NR_06070 [Athalassotoga sp.]|uniref:hypothetical protein n=1 Tax=Athalassotoga sp. TaxID=2022597 RepID=UPI003CFF7D91